MWRKGNPSWCPFPGRRGRCLPFGEDQAHRDLKSASLQQLTSRAQNREGTLLLSPADPRERWFRKASVPTPGPQTLRVNSYQHRQQLGANWFAAHGETVLSCRQPGLQLQLQASAWPLGAAARHRPHGTGPARAGVLHSLQSPVPPNVGDGTAHTKQNWLGLGAVPNIYISNLPLAAVTMATRSPSNKAAQC